MFVISLPLRMSLHSMIHSILNNVIPFPLALGGNPEDLLASRTGIHRRLPELTSAGRLLGILQRKYVIHSRIRISRDTMQVSSICHKKYYPSPFSFSIDSPLQAQCHTGSGSCFLKRGHRAQRTVHLNLTYGAEYNVSKTSYHVQVV